jgi:hypothetical protein
MDSHRTPDEKLPFRDLDRIWLWKDGHHYTQVAYEQPPPHLPAAEFVRADYTWKQLQKRASSDDGVDIEVLVKRQAKRIQDLERQLQAGVVNAGKAYCAQCGSFKLVPFNV